MYAGIMATNNIFKKYNTNLTKWSPMKWGWIISNAVNLWHCVKIWCKSWVEQNVDLVRNDMGGRGGLDWFLGASADHYSVNVNTCIGYIT